MRLAVVPAPLTGVPGRVQIPLKLLVGFGSAVL